MLHPAIFSGYPVVDPSLQLSGVSHASSPTIHFGVDGATISVQFFSALSLLVVVGPISRHAGRPKALC